MKKMRKENLKIVYQYLSDDISPLFAVACDTVFKSYSKARSSWLLDY